MKAFFVFNLLYLFSVIPLASAGNGGRGGVPSAIDEAAFATYVEGGGLKASMINYLRTLDLNQIQDSPATHIKATFEKMLVDQELIKDISTPGNYVAGRDKCRDPFNGQVLAFTHVGSPDRNNIGGKICYDVDGLVKEFKNQGHPLTVDQAAIKLVALTFHEHVHHFQRNRSDNSRVIQEQEKEANDLAGYVELTGNVARVPLVGWSSHVTSASSRAEPRVQVVECMSLSGLSLYMGHRVALKMTVDLEALSQSQAMGLMQDLRTDFGYLVNGSDIFKGPISVAENKVVIYSRLDYFLWTKARLARMDNLKFHILNQKYNNSISVECWNNN